MRLRASLLSAACVLFMFWLAGYDFNERGATATFAFFCTLYIGVSAYCIAGLMEAKP